MREENNRDIRYMMHWSRLPLWRVADELGISENTLGRWMRHELSGERAQQVMQAVEKLAGVRRDQIDDFGRVIKPNYE